MLALAPQGAVDRLNVNPAIELVVPRLRGDHVFFRLLWYYFELPQFFKRHKVNAVYFPGGMLAPVDLQPYRTAVAFQNMLPFAPREIGRFPLGYTRARLTLLRSLQLHSFQRADLVIFLSEYAQAVIDRLSPQRRGHSEIIPHGINEPFYRRAAPLEHKDAPHGYVLYVSILDAYKAQLEVVQAWHLLRQRRQTREKLILVGPEYPWYGRRLRRLIDQLRLQDEVIIQGEVPNARLPAWYQSAIVNVFASSCENCPNILLEALASGRPVLASKYPPMPEFGGNAVDYFDPYHPESLANLLIRYLDDPSRCSEMGAKALVRSQKFEARSAAQRTWDALQRLAYA